MDRWMGRWVDGWTETKRKKRVFICWPEEENETSEQARDNKREQIERG